MGVEWGGNGRQPRNRFPWDLVLLTLGILGWLVTYWNWTHN